jgi:hypothetical protein
MDRCLDKSAKAVYGTCSDFQGVYLRLNCNPASIGNAAIVDEADNTLLDKASYQCKLEENVSGYSTTLPILRLIWNIVSNEENKPRLQYLRNDEEESQKLLAELEESIRAELRTGYNQVLPNHIVSFINGRIPIWIKSAITALRFTINREYSIDETNQKIISIDYANTGEWQYSMMLSNGLHQFLQSKENLPLTRESMVKFFISNYMFINLYPLVIGVTGTSGGEAERETLRELYDVDVRKIPRMQEHNPLNVMTPWIASTDEVWMHYIYCDVMRDGTDQQAPTYFNPPCYSKRYRAVLVVCLTIEDVYRLRDYFIDRGIQVSDLDIIVRNLNDEALAIPDAFPGKIILATCLSGRGMHIDPVLVEGGGGIHVILSFLAKNTRVEDQAFGHMARQDYSGSCRSIIRRGELSVGHYEIIKTPLRDLAVDIPVMGCYAEYQNIRWDIVDEEILDDQHWIWLSNDEERLLVSYRKDVLTITRDEDADAVELPEDDEILVCDRDLTMNSIVSYRDHQEAQRLQTLRSETIIMLARRQELFDQFRARYANLISSLRRENSTSREIQGSGDDNLSTISQRYLGHVP